MAKIDSVHDISDKALVELKSWLEPWFKGRNESGGGGASGPTGILFTWNGYLPVTAGVNTVRHVPYDADGSSLSFELVSAWFRIEASQSGTVSVRLEKSSSGGLFSSTTIDTPSIVAGGYEDTDVIASYPVASGDLVRLSHVTVPSTFTLTVYEVQLLGGVV